MEQFKALLPGGKTVDSLEDLKKLNVEQLKKILVCYKEKTSGVKADLILRAYAIFCRLQNQSEYDCSSSQHPLIGNENHCTYEAIYKSKCSHLPWTSDLRGTPAFSFVQLYDYLVVRTTKFKHIKLKSTAYKKLKAFQFFYEGYIKKFFVARDINFTFFDVRIKASMKNVLYKAIVILSNDSGDVCCAACTCPAGAGISGLGNCNHVGGVLFALEDFNRKGYQSCPQPVSCTSKLSAWNVPSSFTSISPVPIDQIVIEKIKFGRDSGKSQEPKNICHDPRKAKDVHLNEESFEKLKNSLAESTPNSCFFAFHPMPETNPNSPDSPFNDSFFTLSISHSEEPVPFSDSYDISCTNFKVMMDFYAQDNMILSQTVIQNIESATRGQSSNDCWKQHRLYRITASNFYFAAVNKVEPSSKLKSMFYSSFSSTSTRHGQLNESHVRSLYLETLTNKGICDAHIDEPGLIISGTHSFLGASLDGIVWDGEDSWGLEIKCPSSKFGMSLETALGEKNFFLTKKGKVQLKKTHKFFYQIQGQMFCTGLKRVDLVVWFGDKQPLFIQKIDYDGDFVKNSILPQLTHFYTRAVLPEFFTKRVKRGYKLYIHGGWGKYLH